MEPVVGVNIAKGSSVVQVFRKRNVFKDKIMGYIFR